MYSEYSMLALAIVAGLVVTGTLLPFDINWSISEELEFQEMDFDMDEESLNATQTNNGAATTSSI